MGYRQRSTTIYRTADTAVGELGKKVGEKRFVFLLLDYNGANQ